MRCPRRRRLELRAKVVGPPASGPAAAAAADADEAACLPERRAAPAAARLPAASWAPPSVSERLSSAHAAAPSVHSSSVLAWLAYGAALAHTAPGVSHATRRARPHRACSARAERGRARNRRHQETHLASNSLPELSNAARRSHMQRAGAAGWPAGPSEAWSGGRAHAGARYRRRGRRGRRGCPGGLAAREGR
eukprot:scaffold10079_cov113-Isochrysis_galbana.AAC.2